MGQERLADLRPGERTSVEEHGGSPDATVRVGNDARAPLNRRRFLRNTALAAGAAGLSAVEWLQPTRSWAQANQPNRADQVILLSSFSTRVDGVDFCGEQLLVGRHSYLFDYRFGKGNPPVVPNGLITNFREGLCETAAELERVERPVQFKNLAEVPREFPPAPTQGFGNKVLVYRMTEQISDEILRVYEWCSFVCAPDQIMRIKVEQPYNQEFYRVIPDPDGPAIPVDVTDDFPRVDSFELVRAASPVSTVGPVFYAARNQESAQDAWVRWQRTLELRNRQDLRPLVHIPGTDKPEERTKQARYQVMHADGIAIVTVDQQKAKSEWVTLGVFPFRPGNVTVMLTDTTGEPSGQKIVVADAIRWLNG